MGDNSLGVDYDQNRFAHSAALGPSRDYRAARAARGKAMAATGLKRREWAPGTISAMRLQHLCRARMRGLGCDVVRRGLRSRRAARLFVLAFPDTIRTCGAAAEVETPALITTRRGRYAR